MFPWQPIKFSKTWRSYLIRRNKRTKIQIELCYATLLAEDVNSWLNVATFFWNLPNIAETDDS